jgi:hypothetical protein
MHDLIRQNKNLKSLRKFKYSFISNYKSIFHAKVRKTKGHGVQNLNETLA